MIATSEAPESKQGQNDFHTLWGLTPAQLHARFWKSRGIQVVPCGSPDIEIDKRAELYLMTSREHLVIMPLPKVLELMCWLNPDLLMTRLRQSGRSEYREVVEARADGQFLRFRREYESSSGHRRN